MPIQGLNYFNTPSLSILIPRTLWNHMCGKYFSMLVSARSGDASVSLTLEDDVERTGTIIYSHVD